VIDAMGVVNEAVEDGVGISRVSHSLSALIRLALAADPGTTSQSLG
jgi:hypothetical protein